MIKNPVLYIVVPCYNEEEVLPETTKRLNEKLTSLINNGKVSKDSRVLFVNDGSKDKTWSLIEETHNSNNLFEGVKLSRNFGHQNALMAGLSVAKEKCDISISMDADLQDDINAIGQMIDAYYEGNEVVYGVRSARKKDTFFKKATAEGFYKLMKKMGVDIVFNHADYRLLSKVALDRLFQFDENNLFIRGIVPRIGYQSTTVEYERNERFAGTSKYPLKKMLAFAVDGITSFSIKPLFNIFWLGVFMACLGFVSFVTLAVLMYFFSVISILWPIVAALMFFTGIILIVLGVVAVYVGKSYMEIKHRPTFIIEKVI